MRNLFSTLALTTLVCFAPSAHAAGSNVVGKITLPKNIAPSSVITGLPNLNTIPTEEYDAGVTPTPPGGGGSQNGSSTISATLIAQMTAAIKQDPSQADAIVKELAAQYPELAAQIAAEAAKLAPAYATQIAKAATEAAPAEADAIADAVIKVVPANQAQAVKDAVNQAKPASAPLTATNNKSNATHTGSIPGAGSGGSSGTEDTGAASPAGSLF